MKSKPVHKKGKKRPLVEGTSSPLKPDQKSENVVESKRNRKKIKNDNNIQNGDSVSNTKALQKVTKQKKKQKKVKDKSDNNTIKLPAVKIKTNIDKKIKPTLAESKEKTLDTSKEKKQEHLKNKQLTREMNKVISRTRRYKASNSVVDLTILKNKVSEIRSREVLSKTAKKRIAVLLRKIRVLEKEKANQSETVEEDDKEDKQQANVSAEKKQKSTTKDKRKTKKEHGKNKKAKVNKEEDNDEDQSDIEEEEMDIMQEDIDVDSVEDEEDEENEEMAVVEVKKKKKKATDKSSGAPKKKETKKKQHILFVGNLPHDTTSNELGQHFQSKVDTVISVHIPIKPGTNKLCNFAYVELSNNADCEKALALNHTFLRNKKINVQYAASKSPNKVDSVAKNKKLQVLCKTGKFTGVKGKKKLSKKGKQKFAGSKV